MAAQNDRRFSKGDMVVLVPPSDDDLYKHQWNELMDLYVGHIGVITSVLGDYTEFNYRVEFDPPVYINNEITRNFWYLRENWCESAEAAGAYEDLDAFISEFSS